MRERYLCGVNYKIRHVLKGHGGPVYALSDRAGDDSVYSGASDGIVAKWNIESGKPEAFSVRTGKPVFSILFHGNLLLAGQGEGGIHVVDFAAGKEVRFLKYHRLGVFAMACIDRENLILSAGGDGFLCIYDANDFRLLNSIAVSPMKLRCIASAPDEGHVVVGGSDGFLRLFDTAYFNEIQSFKAHEGGVYSARFISESTLVTGGRDAHLRFWKLDGNRLIAAEALPAHNFAIYDIALHPDSRRLATASRDKTAKIWQLGDMKSPIRLARNRGEGHTHSVNAVHFSNNGELLVTAGDDRTLMVWEPASV